ncbi:unnamed protein product [Caenorhabditis brenneri]
MRRFLLLICILGIFGCMVACPNVEPNDPMEFFKETVEDENVTMTTLETSEEETTPVKHDISKTDKVVPVAEAEHKTEHDESDDSLFWRSWDAVVDFFHKQWDEFWAWRKHTVAIGSVLGDLICAIFWGSVCIWCNRKDRRANQRRNEEIIPEDMNDGRGNRVEAAAVAMELLGQAGRLLDGQEPVEEPLEQDDGAQEPENQDPIEPVFQQTTREAHL